MKLTVNFIFLLVVVLLLTAVTVSAEVPQVINYQGRLTDSNDEPVADGPYQIKFKIYGSAAGDDSLWWSGFQSIQVTSGLFSYQLGSTAPIPDNLFATDTTRYLGITAGADPEITPRTKLTSVPYAYQALRADSATSAVSGGGWTDNGTILNLTTATDKIGIGVADPGNSKLEVFAYGTPGCDVAISGNGGLGGGLGTGGEFTGGLVGANCIAFKQGTQTSYGVKGSATGGTSGSNLGLWGHAYQSGSGDCYGVYGFAEGFGAGMTNYGVYGRAVIQGPTNWAGYFYGDVHVNGTLSKAAGSFKIDHPLDPENKYLYHSFVESPDMMNVYNGNVKLDANGEAVVELPHYFDALNTDFRYQLTPIGAFAPVYVAEKITGNRFKIAGGRQGMEVSWQVTGIRKDAFAEANRIQVEVGKPDSERGRYLHPEAFDLGEEYGLHYEEHKRMEEEQKRTEQEWEERRE